MIPNLAFYQPIKAAIDWFISYREFLGLDLFAVKHGSQLKPLSAEFVWFIIQRKSEIIKEKDENNICKTF